MRKKLYEYAVLLHPSKEEEKEGKSTQVLTEVTHILAASEPEANMKISRSIPEEYVECLDRVEIALRPF